MTSSYDLLIIGAGPAGLMAAAQASYLGASVLLVEKNKQPALKLLITGGGRCNITNLNFRNIREFAAFYKPADSFLLPAFSRFGPLETIDFFAKENLALVEEDNYRVFPGQGKARSVLNCLLDKINKQGGEILLDSSVKEVLVSKSDKRKIEKVKLANGDFISAKNFLIATGGKSYPSTGSSGDGYSWLKKLGHRIISPYPALVAIKLKEKFIKDLEGLSFSNIKISFLNFNKKIISESGDIIFTTNAISGPAALNLSRFLTKSDFNKKLIIDFFPQKSNDDLNNFLQQLFHKGKKSLKNALAEILPLRFVNVFVNILKIEANSLANSLSRENRNLIVKNLKEFELSLISNDNFDKAMVASGGLSLSEINAKNFKSKLFTNLYCAGEVLDIVGPTGGFNLQLAWTSGFLVAEDVVKE